MYLVIQRGHETVRFFQRLEEVEAFPCPLRRLESRRVPVSHRKRERDVDWRMLEHELENVMVGVGV